MAAREKRSADAESVPVTVADGIHTHGVLNQHPKLSSTSGTDSSAKSASNGSSSDLAFRVGISEDSNKKWRRAMEDAHAFIYDFGDVHGQGFFGIFDGHAGKDAAEWCGQNFHQYLLKTLDKNEGKPVPDILNITFHSVDRELANLASQKGSSSGCTAAVAFLRLEDDSGQALKPGEEDREGSTKDADGVATAGEQSTERGSGDGIWGKLSKRFDSSDSKSKGKQSSSPRRVLYTANVGDARAVLCRGGKAVRLTYDHKGSDAQEAKRITDAGGFVMNARVNGVLAVTRSLGDSAMKEFVVGSPYTTETVLSSEDSFLIIACDGLWDVIEDQEAVNLIRDEQDPQAASQKLLEHALNEFSTDNTSVMVVRFSSS
ncbi:Protein phosphatase 2C (PP2C)-like domain protein [Kalmanozyma brasiliensis GHG001]|uniref:Protein phosphatase 2C (PP2C)-like domain protein n=1 Tax=Kalmanozyma brasiliensis (strain GHG001) TaxID=1365824 RepID=UPI002867D5E6|nr:Protein phosphatase 2C (PP2C)-like domain protein [Kalmanozyma brasiliensis GHG001]EST06040.2 Protein phosphatase 2C (PP2C)-like domain protein [Kalmanozyma brasiliensis GHG001]